MTTSAMLTTVDATYDPTADAAYVSLRAIAPGEARENVVIDRSGGAVVLDFNDSGTLLGIKILGA